MDAAGVHARPRSAGKKLAEAARLWARGELANDEEKATDADHLDDVAAVFGIDLDGVASREQPRVFYLWPENVEAWGFFLSCRTQWRHGFSGPTGLDYAGVECLMRQFSLSNAKRLKLWPLVRAAEGGYLQGLHERMEQEQGERG